MGQRPVEGHRCGLVAAICCGGRATLLRRERRDARPAATADPLLVPNGGDHRARRIKEVKAASFHPPNALWRPAAPPWW